MKTIYAVTYNMLYNGVAILTTTQYVEERKLSSLVNRIKDDRNRELTTITRGTFQPS